MADEQVVIEEQKTEAVEDKLSSILQQAAFDDKVVVEEKKQEIIEEKKEEIKVEEIPIPKDWLKKEFDTEDPALLKAEREELKSVKEKLQKFEVDENGFKVLDYLKPENEDKLYAYLDNKKKIEKLTSNEVTESNAAEIVKFQLQQKYNTLSADDINYKFNRQYGVPKEPQEDKFLTKEDYDDAKAEWDEKVENSKKELLLDAKLAVPEIQKLKTELTLPNIERVSQQKEPTQEELAARKKNVDAFSQFAETTANSFTGFTVQVKNKDVDYLVSYASSQDEKTFIAKELRSFAENNFDANALLADRWVEADGKTIKVEQMVKDLSRIHYGEQVEQKIALEAANKRMDEYLKEKKQIDLDDKNEEGKLKLDKVDEKLEDKLRDRMLQLT